MIVFAPVSRTGSLFDRIKWPFLAAIGIFFFIALGGCSHGVPEKKFRIGFAQCTGKEKWKKTMWDAIQRELAFHPGTELVYRSADDNSELQIRQIRDLLTQNIDILLVSPNEAAPLTPIVEEAYNKGIPVIVIDRKTTSNLYTSFIGINNYELGKMAGAYLAGLFPDSAQIVEIIGLAGSTPSVDRQRGFEEGITLNPKLRIRTKIHGDWLREKATAALTPLRAELRDGDLVFAQNDPMALGAHEVYESLGLHHVHILGVDGLPGPGGGMQLVADKVLQATFLTPTGGEEAIQTAFQILQHKPYQKINLLPTVVIDSTNVGMMQRQTEKIDYQQNEIRNQDNLLREQRRIYHNQSDLLYLAVAALLVALGLGGLAWSALRNNRRKNKQLAAQNQEILDQKNQLVVMTTKAREASEAKFAFFTQISHELRTPLSLILGPLDNALASSKITPSVRSDLEFMHRNALRLFRLINQLMDFRKIEVNKMKIRAAEHNITQFVEDVGHQFNGLATRKRIRFQIKSSSRDLMVWFDGSMMEKVLFNLLANAFKFTSEEGNVTLSVSRDAEGKEAIVSVSDTGIGMSEEDIEHAFELFYQGHKASFKGTGLGLSVSREVIALHGGSIRIESEKWKGATFTVRLPLGTRCLEEAEIVSDPEPPAESEDLRVYTTDILPLPVSENNEPAPVHDQSILLIEDNDDMRAFLRGQLSKHYEIHEASSAESGLELAFSIVPDLIVSDVILPGKDGLSLTGTIKQDIRTSHIPIVLLTAKGTMEDQIRGLSLSADAFVIKPFNLEYLMVTIRNLLTSRSVLREHYTGVLPSDSKNPGVSKIDRKFINEFTSLVENQLSNQDFSIEEICREIGISRMQLYRKVKALMGYNVNDYILTVRLQRAKYCLVNEADSISEVAFKVGFATQAYFSTVFKSKFGITPTEFRERKNGARRD